MAYRSSNRRGRFVPAAALAAASWAVLQRSGPVLSGAEINTIPALAACFLVIGGSVIAADLMGFAAEFFDWIKARMPTGLKGTAGFVKALRELRGDLIAWGWGPYWGTFGGREIISGFSSNALTVGPSGSGKGVGSVLTNILSIRESKTIIDFKGELSCMLAEPLRRRGERVKILNLGDVWTDLLGTSALYNPLCVIADNYTRPGGLLDVSDDCHEITMQLYPEPGGGDKDGNGYFRIGSRTLIGFAIQFSILTYGLNATLGDVSNMLNSRAELLRNAQWAAGRLEQKDGTQAAMPIEESPWAGLHDSEDLQDYITYFRGLAAGVADLLEIKDGRAAEAFLTGAQNALERFNQSTRAFKKTSRTTFRFAEQKEGDAPTTVFIVADASRINAQAPVLGLLQWCMFTELKRHENKHREVFLCADECTNYKLHDLGSLLTWGRGYGLRLHLILQSFSAFRRVYGQDVLNTLLSETEIKQFLSGQREPETLSIIEQLLGEQSIIARNHSGKKDRGLFGIEGEDYREEGRVLMTKDEIRRTDKSILIIRKNKPILTELPPIAAIAPWRKQIGINPFYGRAFLRPVKLRLYGRIVRVWAFTQVKRGLKRLRSIMPGWGRGL